MRSNFKILNGSRSHRFLISTLSSFPNLIQKISISIFYSENFFKLIFRHFVIIYWKNCSDNGFDRFKSNIIYVLIISYGCRGKWIAFKSSCITVGNFSFGLVFNRLGTGMNSCMPEGLNHLCLFACFLDKLEKSMKIWKTNFFYKPILFVNENFTYIF